MYVCFQIQSQKKKKKVSTPHKGGGYSNSLVIIILYSAFCGIGEIKITIDSVYVL